jgi:transcriptional regulator with XRE-family HTH domain
MLPVRFAANMAATDHDTLGDFVREERTKQHLRLRELATRLELAPSYISDIENNRRVPSEDVLLAIAKELGVNFEDLMARAGRLGSDAERNLRRRPVATTLFRKIYETGLDDADIQKLVKRVEQMGRDKESGR